MATQRRVAHFGLVSAGLLLVSTLTILFQGSGGAVVGQEPAAQPAPAVQRHDVARQASARAVNVAAINK
jgi:hypothetical protein